MNEYDELYKLTEKIIEQMNEEGWHEREFGSSIPCGNYRIKIDVTVEKTD